MTRARIPCDKSNASAWASHSLAASIVVPSPHCRTGTLTLDAFAHREVLVLVSEVLVERRSFSNEGLAASGSRISFAVQSPVRATKELKSSAGNFVFS